MGGGRLRPTSSRIAKSAKIPDDVAVFRIGEEEANVLIGLLFTMCTGAYVMPSGMPCCCCWTFPLLFDAEVVGMVAADGLLTII